MITTIETRLKLTDNQLNLIDSSIVLLSKYFRKTLIMFNNKKLSETDIYSKLSKTNDLTSYEIDSLIVRAKTEHSKIKELTKTQKKQFKFNVAQAELELELNPFQT